MWILGSPVSVAGRGPACRARSNKKKPSADWAQGVGPHEVVRMAYPIMMMPVAGVIATKSIAGVAEAVKASRQEAYPTVDCRSDGSGLLEAIVLDVRRWSLGWAHQSTGGSDSLDRNRHDLTEQLDQTARGYALGNGQEPQPQEYDE